MKHLLYNKIVVDAGDELIPFIKVHPFNNKYLLTIENTLNTSVIGNYYINYNVLFKNKK